MKPHCALLPLLLVIVQPLQADLNKGLEAVASQRWADALHEFRPLAERGDPNAQVNLGNLYMRGLAVKQDYHTASIWYARAARQGHAAGQAKLGLMHYYGLGVEEDPAEAMRWFLAAGEQGDPEAAMVLGTLYDQGTVGKRQPAEAYLWYSIAADLGKEDAASSRTRLLDELSPTEVNEVLTRLNVWRVQHDGIPPDWPGYEFATTINRSPTESKPIPAPKSAAADGPAKKRDRNSANSPAYPTK